MSAGTCPSRVDDGYGLSLATVDRLAAARHARCWSPSTAGSRRSTRSPPRGRPGSTWSSATTTRRAPTARCPTARSSTRPCAAIRAPICAGPAVAYKLAQALGRTRRRGGPRAGRAGDGRRPDAAAGREPPARARGPARARRAPPSPGLRALMDGRRSADPSALDTQHARVPPGAADQRRRAGCGAPTRGSSCCSPTTERRAAEIAAELDASTPSGARSSSGSCWEAEALVARAGRAAAPTCWPARAGTRA